MHLRLASRTPAHSCACTPPLPITSSVQTPKCGLNSRKNLPFSPTHPLSRPKPDQRLSVPPAFFLHSRVRRTHQRLPSSLLIENASERPPLPTRSVMPRRFRSSLATSRTMWLSLNSWPHESDILVCDIWSWCFSNALQTSLDQMPSAKFQTLPRRGKRGRSCDSSHVS